MVWKLAHGEPRCTCLDRWIATTDSLVCGEEYFPARNPCLNRFGYGTSRLHASLQENGRSRMKQPLPDLVVSNIQRCFKPFFLPGNSPVISICLN